MSGPLGFGGGWRGSRGRPMAVDRGGMVATAHPLATQAGAEVLEEGGNAVDAAIAAAGVLAVALPPMNGLGGDALLLRATADGELSVLVGCGRVGSRATRERLAQRGHERVMPLRGPLAVGVPGAVGTYLTALELWGSRDLERVWRPAVRFARSGIAVTRPLAESIEGARDEVFVPSSELAALFMPDGRPLREGDCLIQPLLATTLEHLASLGPRSGLEEFYRGRTGAAIADHVFEGDGLFDRGDMAAYATELMRPISIGYRGFQIHQCPPPSQGVVHLEAMGIIEGWPAEALARRDAGAVHWMVEAKKAAFADRHARLRDPMPVGSPIEWLLSPALLAARRREITERAKSMGAYGAASPGDTTYLAVADQHGTCVSLVTSLSNSFGSGVMVPGTGILLNNRAGRGFSLDAGHPNVLEPGKRTITTLNAYAVTAGGRPVLVGGTPGGDAQAQINLQVLSAIVDAGVDVQQAADLPRWRHEPSSDPAGLASPERLSLEPGLAPLLAELRERGHLVEIAEGLGGAVQMVAVDLERGVFAGGSDARAGGCAFGPG